MAYNISSWQQIEAVGNKIPLASFIQHVEGLRHVESVEISGAFLKVVLDAEEGFVKCSLDHGSQTVVPEKIACSGEFSHHVYHEMLKETFPYLFKQYLALAVWANGDTVEFVAVDESGFREQSAIELLKKKKNETD
jgi:hypothetical protein